jgi:membrane associated rhomboid family serine protease
MMSQVSPLERIKIFFGRREALPRIILINIAVWLVIILIRNLAFLFSSPDEGVSGLYKYNLSQYILSVLALPANITEFLTKPWTLFSYMFLHFDFLHILFNMLWLYWFGVIFVQYLSQRQFLGTYIFGGIVGGLLYMLAYNVFPVFNFAREASLALGASASVLAVVVAISFYVPNYTINLFLIGPVKIKYIALFSIMMDLLMINSGNAGGHIAHLGGALWGYAYVRMLPYTDPTRIFDIFKKGKANPLYRSNKRKFKVNRGPVPISDEDYNLQKKEKQERIDSILDKISKSGYQSLTKEEKELLFSSSNKQNK